MMPFAFTEHGALMAASVLNTPRAVEVSLYAVRASDQTARRAAFCLALRAAAGHDSRAQRHNLFPADGTFQCRPPRCRD